MLANIPTNPLPQVSKIRATTSRLAVMRPAGASLHRLRHDQQTRSYRSGMWSSYLDPEFHRDLRRRHRMLKHKYSESLGRRLKWDQDPLGEDPRTILRRLVGRYWYSAEPSYCSSRIIFHNGSAHSHARTYSSSGANNGRVYTSSNSTFGGDFDSWKSELNDMVNSWAKQKQTTKGTKRAKSTSSAASKKDYDESPASNTQVEEEYVIDPITNRKVLKKSYGSIEDNPDSSVGTFKSYRSQFSMFAPPDLDGQAQQQPVHSDGPPPTDELTKYKEVDFDPEAPLAQGIQIETEEYSLNHLPPEEAAEIREDVDKYKTSEYDQVQPMAESHPEKYEDLHKYEPTQYDEVKATPEDHAQQYEDLHKYKPYRYNEDATPDQDPSPAYDDLHAYRPYLHNEDAAVAESAPQYDDLAKYEGFERDVEIESHDSEPIYKDLDQYAPSNFSDGIKKQHAIPAYNDLDSYDRPFHYEEGKVVPEAQEKYEDLSNYEPKECHNPVTGEAERPFEQYGDLEKYKAYYRYKEPEGKAVLEKDIFDVCLKDPETKREARQNLEQSLSDHIVASDAADRDASANVKLLRQRSKEPLQPSMTGNFVRDFPEEFASVWSSSSSGLYRRTNPSTYEQQIQASIQSSEKTYSDTPSSAGNALLQPALDRQSKSRAEPPANQSRTWLSHQQKKRAITDPYSKVPQGLETSFAEECGEDPTGPSYIRQYGSLNKAENEVASEPVSAVPLEELVEDIPLPNQVSAASTTSNAESTVYKILAYDATMQSVSIAETASVVPDQVAPLTPAEVLLRLSNPAKFFPHFAPLQAQGFEIVSGSGDVLIFRKVMDTSRASGANSGQTPINPIDMMGAPSPSLSAAAFASPTGFVNYDAPAAIEDTTAPVFKSNIGVRREEPVFSGSGAWGNNNNNNNKKKKKSVTKRVLIGGVWIAGLSYALGVMGEYFATGGIDGKGPTGF